MQQADSGGLRTSDFGLRTPLVAPSLIAADFGRLADEVARVERAEADWLHLDVMDGHFVPNLTMGVDVLKGVRPGSKLFFDCHLMVTDPLKYAEAFAKAGAQSLTFHIEVAPQPAETVKRLRDLGLKVGLALNPETPTAAVEPFLDLPDMVLVMTVHPGFTGQAFLPACVDKVRRIASLLPAGRHLEVDGGINPDSARLCVEAGANVLVAGAAVFRVPGAESAIRRLRGSST
jgi:ribulose-phosphate 3-epimerase